MPFVHYTRAENATALLQQTLHRAKTPATADPLHIMDVHALRSLPLRDELRLHARYIRDTLVPLLSRQPRLTHSDTVLLQSIFKKLEATHVTLDLLRYSRIEKALMVIAVTGATTWPIEVVVQAENLIQQWEDELGPLKNLRSDLYGPGGRLEGLTKIVDGKKGSKYERDDDAKSAWSVDVVNPFRSHTFGSLGFEVGDWWLKPAAAYRDGIIDKTAHAITSDEGGAYAILVTGSSEQGLRADGRFVYHAPLHDPGVFKLTMTMTSDTEKVVRVLRSWKLRSILAPKAGLRYDGLYRIKSFGIKLEPPNSWHTTFTLLRLSDQPPIATALGYPMSDQLDDWRDYQRLKNVDHGEDFAMLREILRGPHADSKAEIFDDYEGGEDMKRGDSGYFSRRSSKMSSRVHSMRLEFPESTLDNVPESAMEIDFELVAEGTPTTQDSANQSTDEGAHYSSDYRKLESNVNAPRSSSDPELHYRDQDSLGRSQEKSDKITREADEAGIHRPEKPKDWAYQYGIWRSGRLGLDGVEQDEFVRWASTTAADGIVNIDGSDDGDDNETVADKRRISDRAGNGQAAALKDMKNWTFDGKSTDRSLTGRGSGQWAPDTIEAGEEAAKRRSLTIRGE